MFLDLLYSGHVALFVKVIDETTYPSDLYFSTYIEKSSLERTHCLSQWGPCIFLHSTLKGLSLFIIKPKKKNRVLLMALLVKHSMAPKFSTPV